MAKLNADQYQVNGIQVGRTRVFIGDYDCGGDNRDVTIGSLAGFSFFEVVSNRNGKQASSGLCSCADGSIFTFYYPSIMAGRGYKVSDTVLHIDDTDGSTKFSVYGII